MTAVVDVAQAAKVEGQARAGRRLTDEHREALRRAVLAMKPGTRFTVNDVRHHLDDADVPPPARASLFTWLARQGLIEPLRLRLGGVELVPKLPSSGRSAHRAGVVVWERLGGAPTAAGAPER